MVKSVKLVKVYSYSIGIRPLVNKLQNFDLPVQMVVPMRDFLVRALNDYEVNSNKESACVYDIKDTD